MEWALTVLLIAVSLALDAFAVAVSCGISSPGSGPRQAVRVGAWFGAFQFLMPLAGWRLGAAVGPYLRAAGDYLAFALLTLIGARMAAGALGRREEPDAPGALTAPRLGLLALATSIDALAVGVSLAFTGERHIWAAAGVIGAVAFGLSLAGGLAGRRLGELFQTRAELAGGLVLVGIGVRILLEHLWG